MSSVKETPLGTLDQRISDAVLNAGYDLDSEQLHVGGERAQMSAHKLVLTGTDRKDGARVVIKASLDDSGARDIEAEHAVRALLARVRFAAGDLMFPKERMNGVVNGVTLSVTEFIEQERVFVDYPLREQFFMMLKLFESQEEFHATTYEHVKSLHGAVPVWTSKEYLADAKDIGRITGITTHSTDLMLGLNGLMMEHASQIDRYSGFLNHSDLVPHNMRVLDGNIYALDQVAIRFGNKYEMWARFINYMLIHNPPLADLLVEYVREKRGADDAEMLRVMRCYKAGFLARYYQTILASAEGAFRELTEKRLTFWQNVLEKLLANEPIPSEMVSEYTAARDSLRTEDEKKRQREFAKA